MDSFERYFASIFETEDVEETRKEVMTHPEKIKALAEARKANVEADEYRKTEEVKRRKMELEMQNFGKVTAKEVIMAIPAFITAGVGVFGLVSAVQQNKARCQTDLAIAATKSNNKLRLLDIATRKNETDILVDKPIKVVNELDKD